MIAVVATPILAAILWAIARIDADTYRIPDALSLPLIALGLVVSAFHLGGLPWDSMIGAVAGYGIFAGLGAWVYRRRSVEALGLGDAKLNAAAGAWLGWPSLPWVVLLAAAGALCWVGFRRTDGETRVAFGPWLAGAIFVVWVWKNFAGPWLQMGQ